MGIYVNPGNLGFQQIRNSEYVDKSGLIDYINSVIDTPDKLICASRPRRFGKSFAAKMLCAYYDKTCDSRSLFEGLEVSKSSSFEKYLNHFDVIYLDLTRFMSIIDEPDDMVSDIQNAVIRELEVVYPGSIKEKEKNLADALVQVTQDTGNRFLIIIDEWDAVFREMKENVALQEAYLRLLRGLFKGGPATDLTVAGAYMTGILPIKKYGTQSALTDFREYTMIRPLNLAQYVGFTEAEVKELCRKYHMDFENMRKWYDGYSFHQMNSVYSPNSVIRAVRSGEFGDYWTETETYVSLKNYISMNLDGLRDAVVAMLGGEKIKVYTRRFQNDMSTFKSKDDVLTLLVHLGYLAYDYAREEVGIPNQEIADEFRNAIEGDNWKELEEALAESEKLLEATLRGDQDVVAAALDRVHADTSSVLAYNNENSLSCAITIAYYTAQKDYTIVRELPSGLGYADLAFIPRKGIKKPALIVELKYDKGADGAIRQIREKRYAGVLKEYEKDLLLVGISYDKRTKRHECVIEPWGSDPMELADGDDREILGK